MNVKYGKLFVNMLLGLVISSGSQVTHLAQTKTLDGTVSVKINLDTASVVAGDWVEFNTEISNFGQTTTPKLVAHLNIAAVLRGPYVDPEDWSPVRTQYIDPIRSGDSVTRYWEVHTLIDGEFAVFVTIVSSAESFNPEVSPTLLIHVEPDEVLPLNDVLLVAVVVPLFPLVILVFSFVKSRSKYRDTK